MHPAGDRVWVLLLIVSLSLQFVAHTSLSLWWGVVWLDIIDHLVCIFICELAQFSLCWLVKIPGALQEIHEAECFLTRERGWPFDRKCVIRQSYRDSFENAPSTHTISHAFDSFDSFHSFHSFQFFPFFAF